MQFERHEIDWTAEKSRRIWDYYGSNPKYREVYFGFMAGAMVAPMIKAAIPPGGRELLDFSCGKGDVIASLIKRLAPDQRLHATDFTATYVDEVRARFAGDRRFSGATLLETLPGPMPAASFDLVFATEVIEHLKDDELAGMLAECKRLLRPGGRIFLTTPNDEDYDASKLMCPDCGCVFHRWQHVRTWSAPSLRDYMEAAGFRTVRIDAVAWQSWHGKLLALLRTRRIARGGLVYVGEMPG